MGVRIPPYTLDFCEVDCWSSNLSHKQVYEGSIPSFATFLFFWLPNIDLDVIILMKESRRASSMFTRVNESEREFLAYTAFKVSIEY